jgi:hypothetical protein
MTRCEATASRWALPAALCAVGLVVLTTLQGCNSILSNALEAGTDTVLDTPIPTPTPAS